MEIIHVTSNWPTEWPAEGAILALKVRPTLLKLLNATADCSDSPLRFIAFNSNGSYYCVNC